MRFASEWTDVLAGDGLDPENGTHSPPWDDLDKDAQNMIMDAARGAEDIIGDLAGKKVKGADEKLYLVQISGYVPEGPDDTTKGSTALSVDESGSQLATSKKDEES